MTASTAPRRVLIITFHYPPASTSSGWLRPLKLGKYLLPHGWESSFLTVPLHCHEHVDENLLRLVPAGARIHRARCADTKAALAIRGIYPGFLAVPDRYVSWLFDGVRQGRRIVAEEGIDAILSTSPVPTAHLIGSMLQRMTSVPWIADFRDPWVETEGSEVYGRIRQAVELRLERRVVTTADAVVATTRELVSYLRDRYPTIDGRCHAVYNGYDEDDFAALPTAAEPNELTFAHAGLLDPNYRNPIPFLRAVRDAMGRGDLPPSTRVEIIGAGEYAASADFRRQVANLRMSDVVQIIERIPYRDALIRMGRAAALLLLQGGDDTRSLIPAKAFEYLRLGRPILTLAPTDSATVRLVQEFRGTYFADANDVAGIGAVLPRMRAAFDGGERCFDREAEGLSRYSRPAAAADLAAILDRLVAPGGTGRA